MGTHAQAAQSPQSPTTTGDIRRYAHLQAAELGYQTGLETHLTTVEALDAHAKRQWPRIDKAEVTYVYPFALLGTNASPEHVLERAVCDASSWSLGPQGIGPEEVYESRLSDRWRRAEPADPPHEGVTIRLPEIYLKTTRHEAVWADPEGAVEWPLLKFAAEIRLSSLGNHYVRVSSQLEEATLHDLNQALRRAGPGMGDEVLTFVGGDLPTPLPTEEHPEEWQDPVWTKFVSPDRDGYVQYLIEWVKESLAPDAQMAGDPIADFHVVVGIRKASLRREDRRPVELADAVGAALLFRPAGSFATSLEEWAAYPKPKIDNLLDDAREGELIVRTADSTVAYLPASPEWERKEYGEMIEFVASISPVFTVWEQRLRDDARDVEAHLRQAQEQVQRLRDDGASAESDNAPDSLDLRPIHDRQAELHGLEAEIRRRLANLHSPKLVRSRSTRTFLDVLWKAAGIPSLEDGLDRQLTVSSSLQEQLAAIVASIADDIRQAEEERQKRLRRSVEVALTIIGAASLAGLFDWLNGGFAWEDHLLVAGEVAILVLVVFFMLLFPNRHEHWRRIRGRPR